MSAVVARRGYALLAGCSAAVHGALLGHAGGGPAAVVLAVMIAGCLWCAYHLWQRGTLAAWTTVALMNLAMIAVHAPAPAHHHHAKDVSASVDPPALMAVAMALATVEVLLAGAVLYLRTRHRAGMLIGSGGR
jgi:hypothetical protein